MAHSYGDTREQPPISQGQQDSPRPARSEEDALRRIESEAANVLKGYPVAAGLTSVADIISHLPPLAPTPPSFFPASNSTSLQPSSNGIVPVDPLFDEYAREIEVMLGGGTSGFEEQWRQNELARLGFIPELRQQLDGLQTSRTYGQTAPLLPPFPFNVPNPLPAPNTSNSLSHRFLDQTRFPLAPIPDSFANASLNPNLSSPATDFSFLDSFIANQLSRVTPQPPQSTESSPIKLSSLPALPSSQPPTPSLRGQQQQPIRPSHVSASSPHPLSMGPPPSYPFQLPQSDLMNGSRSDLSSHFIPPRNGNDNLPQPSPSPYRKRPAHPASSASPLPAPAFSPQQSMLAQGQGQMMSPFSEGLGEAFGEGVGVESAVKRIRLQSVNTNTSVAGSGGSGRGKVMTGETKNIVNRLSDLISDIFLADDSHILDTSTSALGSSAPNPQLRSPSRTASTTATSFFRTTAVSPSDSAPLLATSTLSKLLKYVQSVATKHKGEEMLEDLEDSGLGRLLKLLERSWDGVSDQKYWDAEATERRDQEEEVAVKKGKGKGKGKEKGKSVSPNKKGGKKSRKAEEEEEEEEEIYHGREASTSSLPSEGRRRSSRSMSRSRSPTLQQEQEQEEEEPSQVPSTEYWTAESLKATTRAIRNLNDALTAIRIAISILTLPDVSLPKHLFSSDYLNSILSLLRHSLDSFIIPLLEAPDTSALSSLLSSEYSDTLDKITDVCDNLASSTDLLASLIKQEEMSDELVNSAVFFSLGPFFHEAFAARSTSGRRKSSSTTNAQESGLMPHALKNMRISSLNLVRRIYARYEDQRRSIIEEVLSNLGRGDGGTAKKEKGAIRLRNNATIQTVSALLLHLVQTVSSDLEQQVNKTLSGNSNLESEKDKDGDVDMKIDLSEETVDETGKLSLVSRQFIEPAYDSAVKSARSILDVLFERSAKVGKAAAGTADSEYRKVLDNLIADLLSTLHLPEWPGSELFLGVICRYMTTALADTKTSTEANSLRGIALDHVGSIAARICRDLGQGDKEQFRSLNEIVAERDLEALDKLFSAQSNLLSHLKRLEESSSSGQGAADFSRILFARDLCRARDLASTSLVDIDGDSKDSIGAIQDRLDVLAKSIWLSNDAEDVFGPSSEDAQPRIDAVSLELSRTQPLATMYQLLITRILEASESPQVALRTKALRSISLVLAQDPDLFHQENIRKTIDNRMLDTSPAVRDTTIELVGKYIVSRPDLAVHFLPQILGRLSDAGLGVRRRVVKLLKVLYGVLDDEDNRVKIGRNLVGRVLDEDDGIKDLAIDTIEELWFASPLKKVEQKPSKTATSLSNIVLKVGSTYGGRVPPVEEALRLIMAKHVEKGTAAPLDRLREVMENLIDSLVVESDSMDVVACVRTISILSAVDSNLLSTAKASLLVPFLKGVASNEDLVISDYLLKIFRGAVLAMPKTASKFGRDLQAALVPMLNKPSAQVQTLQGLVSCFTAVVWSQTQDFTTLLRIFNAAMNRVLQEKAKLMDPIPAKSVNLRQLSIVCYLASTLCEHGNFDKLRIDHPAQKPILDRLSPNSIADFVFDTLIELHNLNLPSETKATLVTSLSFIWRSHPTLMLEPSSTDILDAAFASRDTAVQLQILRIIHSFLASQDRSPATVQGINGRSKQGGEAVQMDELVGNVEGFADSGVASSIAQRYLDRIVEAVLSPAPQIQRIGIDVIGMVARSGFSHPLALAPALVAVTASEDKQVASKANSTLTILHQKHASLLVTRFLEPAKVSHTYAKAAAGLVPPRGYHGTPPDSRFNRWFSLVHKEKRQIQLDYLKQISRVFEVEPGAVCSADDVSLARYVAEALSTLDFKRTEEPMLIISRLNAILAVSGLQVLHLLEEGLAGGGGLLALANMDEDASTNGSPAKSSSATNNASTPPSLDLVRQSIVCGLALLLRDHLKQLYSINEIKMAKYVPGKKSPAGDKGCTRRNGASIALGEDGYPRMPFALAPLTTNDDRYAQRTTYLNLIRDDGTLTSLEEVDDGDDDA